MMNRQWTHLVFSIAVAIAAIFLVHSSDPSTLGGAEPLNFEVDASAPAPINTNDGIYWRISWLAPSLAKTKEVLFNILNIPPIIDTEQPIKVQGTRLQRLSEGLNSSISELNANVEGGSANKVTGAQLEEWACIIYESMSVPSRNFHGVDHVFAISEGADPVQTISAYFHDVIYYSIDGGLSELQAEKLNGIIIEEDDGSVRLCDECDIADDTVMSMVISVFGFEPGQRLNPFKGLNEFLSAAIAVRCLQDILPMEHLFRIAACIEATIPFRGTDEEGTTMGEALYSRLVQTRDKFKTLGSRTDEDIVATTRQAIVLANRDVANFAGDPATFLSNTWNLLPESNIAFRHTKVYRISSYTMALKKMTDFFQFLDPDVIFHQFRGDPSDIEYQGKVSRARNNLDIAKKYMNAKLLSISVIGALAEQTGGDAPLSLWVGDPYDPEHRSPRIEDHILPVPDFIKGIVLDETVFRILRDGRDAVSSFDIQNSPLAAYLYGMVGDAGLEKSSRYAVYPMDEANAKLLLQSLPSFAVNRIALACSRVASTRKEELQRIANIFA